MSVRHAHISSKLVHVFFLECIAKLKADIDMQGDVAPEWSSMLTDLLKAK